MTVPDRPLQERYRSSTAFGGVRPEPPRARADRSDPARGEASRTRQPRLRSHGGERAGVRAEAACFLLVPVSVLRAQPTAGWHRDADTRSRQECGYLLVKDRYARWHRSRRHDLAASLRPGRAARGRLWLRPVGGVRDVSAAPPEKGTT